MTMVDYGLGIDVPLDTPFFGGGASSSSDVPFKCPVAIEDHPYVIDWTKYKRTTLQVRRMSADDSVEPGEQTLSAAGVWPRAQDNFFLGAGQEFLDNRFAFESVYVHSGEYPSVRTRFWKSQGVNPWAQGKLSLLPEYESIATSTTKLLVIACANYLYKTDGKSLYFAAAWGTGVPTWTKVTTTNTNAISSLATDGSRVWFACGSQGVFVTVAGTTAVAQAAQPAALLPPAGLIATPSPGVAGANLSATSFTWEVTAVDAFGNETTAGSVAAVLTATDPISEISWSAQPSASSFNVYRYETSAGAASAVLVTNVSSPAFTDDGSIAGSAKTPPASNQTGSSVYQATYLLYAKGHLLASTGRDLVEVLASGSVSFIFEHENPNFVWTGGCETPSAILVCGYAGGVSFVGAIQPDSSNNGATLAPPTWATTLPAGESINDLRYNAGSMLMATSMGIRSGTKPDSTGSFDINPVITDPGNCLCLAAFEQYEYFGFSNYNPTESWAARTTVSGIGRADLGQYTTAGVPAYATDVMSTTTGTVTGIAILNGTPYFVVETSSSNWSLWGPDGNVVASGWIEPGWVRYGTLEDKILVEIDFQHEPLPSGASVVFDVVDEAYNEFSVGTSNATGSTTIDEPFGAGLAVGNRFMPVIILNASTGQSSSPVLVSWISKAMVTTKRQDEILVPIILRDTVATMQAADEFKHYDPYEEFLYLKGLERSGQVVTYTELTDSHSAYIDQIMVEPYNADDARDWFDALVTVKLVTLD